MNPQCLLITKPVVDFHTLCGVSKEVLGYGLTRAADKVSRELSEGERFVSYLAAFTDRDAPPGFVPNLLAHLTFGMMIVADDRDMRAMLQRCSGMVYVEAETTVRGVSAAVVSGTLSHWRDAVASGSTAVVESTVRMAFNEIQSIFRKAGLNVWGDYRAREAPDHTLLLEYKPK